MGLQSSFNKLIGMAAAVSELSSKLSKEKKPTAPKPKGNAHMQKVGKQKIEQKQQFSKLRESLKNDPTFSSLSPAYQELALKEYAKGEKKNGK